MMGNLDRPITFHIRPPAEGEAVRVDRGWILAVFRNLLLNAEKYTPAGSPLEVRAEREDGEIVFSVADRGPGMSEEQAAVLFHRFTRLRLPGHETIPGSGLGLYICRRIVEPTEGGSGWTARSGTDRRSPSPFRWTPEP